MRDVFRKDFLHMFTHAGNIRDGVTGLRINGDVERIIRNNGATSSKAVNGGRAAKSAGRFRGTKHALLEAGSMGLTGTHGEYL